MKNILILGDWLIDEHWVTGVHRVASSRRTGKVHYRVLQKPDSIIKSSVGAGRTASVLLRTIKDEVNSYNIHGIGVWSKGDEIGIKQLLDPADTQSKNMHQLVHSYNSITGSKSNCGSFLNLLDGCLGNKAGTTRVIRIYQQAGSDVDLVQRIDWEVQIPEGKEYWPIAAPKLSGKLDAINTNNEPVKIDAIVIKDFCKGVVSPELIELLVEKYKNIPWYISTKKWMPTWIDKLADIDVRMFFISQVAADEAVQRSDNSLTCWLTQSGMPTIDALKSISKVCESFYNTTNLIIAVTPNNNSAILRYSLTGEEDVKCIPLTDLGAVNTNIPVDFSSIFFSVLTSFLLENSENSKIVESIQSSLEFASTWMSSEAKRILDFDIKQNVEPNIDLSAQNKVDSTIKIYSWSKCKEEWDDALSCKKLGVIGYNEEKPRIQLWRTMTQVNGYVHHEQVKRQTISTLIREIESFHPSQGKNKSYMLIAPPGSGKTVLVERLADTLGCRFLPFNLTQLLSKSDILDCFDSIVTNQARTRHRPFMVFIDEVNTVFNGHNVYPSFMSPLEDRIYVRGGRKFYIDPCIWIFTDTEHPEKRKDGKQAKAKDFCSRLTRQPLYLSNMEEDDKCRNDEYRLENIYLGVCLICHAFPDVNRISDAVLEIFRGFTKRMSVRSMRRFIESFHDIQYGEVRGKNVPKEWFTNTRKDYFDKEIWAFWSKDIVEPINENLVEIEK